MKKFFRSAIQIGLALCLVLIASACDGNISPASPSDTGDQIQSPSEIVIDPRAERRELIKFARKISNCFVENDIDSLKEIMPETLPVLRIYSPECWQVTDIIFDEPYRLAYFYNGVLMYDSTETVPPQNPTGLSLEMFAHKFSDGHLEFSDDILYFDESRRKGPLEYIDDWTSADDFTSGEIVRSVCYQLYYQLHGLPDTSEYSPWAVQKLSNETYLYYRHLQGSHILFAGKAFVIKRTDAGLKIVAYIFSEDGAESIGEIEKGAEQ